MDFISFEIDWRSEVRSVLQSTTAGLSCSTNGFVFHGGQEWFMLIMWVASDISNIVSFVRHYSLGEN